MKASRALEGFEVPDGYRKYLLRGVSRPIMARKGGPTANEIKTKASYEGLRNHQKEFGVASRVAKTLRQSLSRRMSEICETYVSGRLTAQFRNLTKRGLGKPGMRPLFLSQHGHLLNGFEFNTSAPYREIFEAKHFVQPGSRHGQVILHFPAFVPTKTFKYPKEASYFKLFARLIALSDYQYHQVSGEYQPVNKELHGKYGGYESHMLPLLKTHTDSMTHMVSIGGRAIPEGVGLFLVLAVSFYKYEEGTFTHLYRESGMQIRKAI